MLFGRAEIQYVEVRAPSEWKPCMLRKAIGDFRHCLGPKGKQTLSLLINGIQN